MEFQFKPIVLLITMTTTGMAAAPAFAADPPEDNRWYLAPQVTYVWPDDNRGVQNMWGLRLDVGKHVHPNWDLEFSINDYNLDYKGPAPGSSHQTAYGMNGLWFFLSHPRPVKPFLLMGVGANHQRPDAGSSSTDAYVTWGAGFMASPWSWDGAIRVSIQHLNMFGHGNFGDTIASFGLQIPLGAAPERSSGFTFEPAVDHVPAPVIMSPDVEHMALLPPVILLQGVTFAHASDRLLPESQVVLDEAVATLNYHPGARVEIAGHTNTVGGAEYNIDLSLRRAQAVKQYLVDHGIASDRLTTMGYGESQPVASDDTPEGRARNRRVELRVLNEGEPDTK